MSKHRVIRGDAAPIRVAVKISEAEGTVTPVISIRTERSQTPKYLRLRNGDLECYQRVFVKAEYGQEYEITVDEIPEERTSSD